MRLANITVQQIIDALPEPLQLINPDFSVDMSNKALKEKLAGRQGTKCHEKFGLPGPCPSCPMKQALSNNGPESVVIVANDKKQYSAFLLPVGSDAPGIIEVVRCEEPSATIEEEDILERHTQIYSDKIGTLTKAFFGMAHNLKNPLTAIQGKIQLFGMRHPELKSEINALLNQCSVMTQMLGDINRKFKLEQSTSVQHIDMNNLIENELRFINLDLFVKHKIQKEFLPAEDLPPVSARYSDMSMIFDHIIKNSFTALKNAERKSITITTALDGEYVVATIEDRGCGIPSADLPKVFLPFYSAEPDNGDSCETGNKRKGFGLFIVYQLVRRYDGHVNIESTPGLGTKVTLRFPAVKTNSS